MERNAEATRARILEAATKEFAQHGIAGARVDRIAAAAQGNKNLIYVYFGSKEQLFDAVLSAHLRRLHEAVAYTPDDLPGYAGRMFDFTLDNPLLMRLGAWRTLEGGQGALGDAIARGYRQKLEAVEAVFPTADSAISPAALVNLVATLSTAWSANNPTSAVIAQIAPLSRETMRHSVVEAVRALVAATRATPAR